MEWPLGILAGIIFFAYSLYFPRIIRGNPQEFEMDIVQALGGWLIMLGAASRRSLRMLLLGSVVIEAIYLGFALFAIDNLVMEFTTGITVGLESYHLVYVAWNMSKFFKGEIVLKQFFNWQLERASAIMLFTHSFLVIVFLTAY